jgi:hypothetical protein
MYKKSRVVYVFPKSTINFAWLTESGTLNQNERDPALVNGIGALAIVVYEPVPL